jgi:uncharacterized protein (DUF2164 family)
MASEDRNQFTMGYSNRAQMITCLTHRFQFLLVLCFFSSAHQAQIEQHLLLEDWKEHPLLLNEINLLRLEQERVIDSCQAHVLLEFIKAAQFKSYYQLQGLACFDALAYERLLLYTILPSEAGSSFLDLFYQEQAFQGSFLIRVSFPSLVWQGKELDTISSQNYLGNDFAIQQKLKLQLSDQLQFIFNSAKDRGEALSWSERQRGPDFIACGLFYKAQAPLAKIAIGTYQFQWGQGLQLWTSRGMGRSIDLLQSVRVAQGLKSYNGTDEKRFLNGVAIQYNHAKNEYFGLVSMKRIDVPAQVDTLEHAHFITNSSGLHRTELELQRQKQLQEKIAGLAWQRNGAQFKMGSMLLFQQYTSNQFTDSLGATFLKYSPPFLLSLGFQLSRTFKNSFYYLETVQLYQEKLSLLDANALVCGALFHLHSKIQLGCQLRYYGPTYSAFYEQGFRANKLAQNEKGIFLNLTYQLKKRIKWQSYLDQYAFYMLTSKAFPFQSMQFRTVLSYVPKKTVLFQFNLQKQIGQALTFLKVEATTEIKRELTLNTGAQFGYERFKQLSYSAHLTLQYHQLGFPLRMNAHMGAFFIPEQGSAHYQMNYHIGFGSTTMQLIGQGYFLQTTTELHLKQNLALGLRCLWMSKSANFQLENQSFTYLPRSQKLQLDLQLKINF